MKRIEPDDIAELKIMPFIIGFMILFGFATAFFGKRYLVYSFIPTSKIKHRSALVGAFWASLFWVGMKVLFGYYLTNFQTWGKIYGAYALVIVIAFWIYYTGAVFERFFGSAVGVIISSVFLLLWRIVPLILSTKYFQKKDF